MAWTRTASGSATSHCLPNRLRTIVAIRSAAFSPRAAAPGELSSPAASAARLRRNTDTGRDIPRVPDSGIAVTWASSWPERRSLALGSRNTCQWNWSCMTSVNGRELS